MSTEINTSLETGIQQLSDAVEAIMGSDLGRILVDLAVLAPAGRVALELPEINGEGARARTERLQRMVAAMRAPHAPQP